MNEENQEFIEENQEFIEENQENLFNVENELEIPFSSLETSTTILVNGQSLDFYSEMYREIKITNFLLQLILVVIPVLFCCSKIYKAIRSILTVRF